MKDDLGVDWWVLDQVTTKEIDAERLQKDALCLKQLARHRETLRLLVDKSGQLKSYGEIVNLLRGREEWLFQRGKEDDGDGG